MLLQDQLLQIVAGLQDGIEDLLAGRVFHPKKDPRRLERLEPCNNVFFAFLRTYSHPSQSQKR